MRAFSVALLEDFVWVTSESSYRFTLLGKNSFRILSACQGHVFRIEICSLQFRCRNELFLEIVLM